MPILNSVAKAVSKPLPRIISPKAHAVADYMTVGSFFMAGAMFWSRSKRAALSALFCGGAELAVSLLTDYPGGVKRVISFPMHGKIDMGFAAMAATMPEFMAFEDEPETTFFRAQGVSITAVTSLTQFKGRSKDSGRDVEKDKDKEKKKRPARAA